MQRADRPRALAAALLIAALAGCAPAADAPGDMSPVDAGPRDEAPGDDGVPPDAEPPDAGADAMAMDAAPLDAVPADAAPDRGLPDLDPPDAAADFGPPDREPADTAPDAAPVDAEPPDAAPDQGPPDAAPPAGLHRVATRPPRIGWRRGGQAELMDFDPATGFGPPQPWGPPDVEAARFVAVGEAIRLAWSDAAGVWLDGDPPRFVSDGALVGLAALDGAIIALTTHPDPTRARLVRIEPEAMSERVFAVEPDALELLGLATAAGEVGVLTGDGRVDGLYLHRFDAALAPLGITRVCEFGCDRPNARLAGGPALAALYQSTGRLHRVIGEEHLDLGAVLRGGPVDLLFVEGWLAAWSTPSGRRPGIIVEGTPLSDGPVRALALVDDRCAVWLADGVAWGCR